MTLKPEFAPLVSVVLPTHNRPDLLNEALQSLADQSFPDWEAIVVDDASVPEVNGAALYRRFGPRVNLRRHAVRLGGAAAKNTGIRSAVAPVVAFLDDDDLYAPQFLARAAGVLCRHPDLDGLFMSVSWFGNRQPLEVEESLRAMDAHAFGCRGDGARIRAPRLRSSFVHRAHADSAAAVPARCGAPRRT